jgi:hypothetical protein
MAGFFCQRLPLTMLPQQLVRYVWKHADDFKEHDMLHQKFGIPGFPNIPNTKDTVTWPVFLGKLQDMANGCSHWQHCLVTIMGYKQGDCIITNNEFIVPAGVVVPPPASPQNDQHEIQSPAPAPAPPSTPDSRVVAPLVSKAHSLLFLFLIFSSFSA